MQKIKRRFLRNFMPQLRRDRTAKRKLRKLFKASSTSSTRTRRGEGGEEWASSVPPCCLRLRLVKLVFHVTLYSSGNSSWRLHRGKHHPGDNQWRILPVWLQPESVWLLLGPHRAGAEPLLHLRKSRRRRLSENYPAKVEPGKGWCVWIAYWAKIVDFSWVYGSTHPFCVLSQVFPTGVSDTNVQLLGSVSRVASLADISKWNITTVGTLTALMDQDDGSWEAVKVCAVLQFYLCWVYVPKAVCFFSETLCRAKQSSPNT